MRRRLAVRRALVITLALALAGACNTIAGLESLDEVSCADDSDCAPAAECAAPRCVDGYCMYRLFSESERCATDAGVCDNGGRCVDCLTDEHCIEPQRSRCGPEKRCVECLGDENCAEGKPRCVVGLCVQCTGAADCKLAPPSECWRVTCDSHVCSFEVADPDAGVRCAGGTGQCDEAGQCEVKP
jgi:hypothetical protein